MKDFIYNEHDYNQIKRLNNFLPDKLFDSHMHVSHLPYDIFNNITLDKYYKDMGGLLKGRELYANVIPSPNRLLKDDKELIKSVDFISSELSGYKGNVGEIIVLPNQNVEDIEKMIISPKIKGLKCYFYYADCANQFEADVEEYLPESMWEVANKRGMYITLHLVKDKVLADEKNLNYIIKKAKKYPNATLILAHCARAFATWTVFKNVDKLSALPNVWFDFSAICESPAMMYIIQKVGIKRCMWGTDYPGSMLLGKPVAMGDTFYWISSEDCNNFKPATTFHPCHIVTEEFLAIEQASILLNLKDKDVEDLFYNNAYNLFNR